jgi:hypothetical protein
MCTNNEPCWIDKNHVWCSADLTYHSVIDEGNEINTAKSQMACWFSLNAIPSYCTVLSPILTFYMIPHVNASNPEPQQSDTYTNWQLFPVSIDIWLSSVPVHQHIPSSHSAGVVHGHLHSELACRKYWMSADCSPHALAMSAASVLPWETNQHLQ